MANMAGSLFSFLLGIASLLPLARLRTRLSKPFRKNALGARPVAVVFVPQRGFAANTNGARPSFFLGVSARGKADDKTDRLPHAGEKSSRRAMKQRFGTPKPHRQECLYYKTAALCGAQAK